MVRRHADKVPEATLIFWVIKIMATTVGETGAGYLAVHVGLGKAGTSGIMVALLVAALIGQLRLRHYVPWIYWLTEPYRVCRRPIGLSQAAKAMSSVRA
jgi:uncharacterized membrane-anchored protein